MKKWMSLMTVAALIFGVLTGCGGDSGAAKSTEASPSDTASNSETVQEQNAVEQTTEPTQQPEAASSIEESAAPERPMISYPLEGDQLTLTAWTAFQSQTGMVEGYTDWPVIQALQEKTGVNVEWTNVAQNAANDQFMLMISGGDYADIIRNLPRYYSGGVTQAYHDDIILELNDLIDQQMPDYAEELYADDTNRINVTNDSGQMLYISIIYDEDNISNGWTIRKDYLDALKLEVPTNLEELEETLIAMKNAYGGTSPVLMNSGNYANLLSTSFGVTGYDPMDGNAIFYQENGTVKCSLLQDGYREYLDTMNRWLQEGLISTDFMTMTSNPRDPATALLISDGNALFFSSGVNQWDSYKSAAENADFELTAVPMLPKSAGEKLHFPSNSTKVSSNGAWTISSTCADPELAAHFLNYFFTDDGANLVNYGILGESYELVDGKPTWKQEELQKLADEYGIGITSVAQGYYGIVGDLTGTRFVSQLNQFYPESYLSAFDVWADTSMIDGNYNLPGTFISFTSEETEQISAAMSDLSTYFAEHIAKFISGEENVNDQWADFTETLKSMGIEDVTAVYQAAYERYLMR